MCRCSVTGGGGDSNERKNAETGTVPSLNGKADSVVRLQGKFKTGYQTCLEWRRWRFDVLSLGRVSLGATSWRVERAGFLSRTLERAAFVTRVLVFLYLCQRCKSQEVKTSLPLCVRVFRTRKDDNFRQNLCALQIRRHRCPRGIES